MSSLLLSVLETTVLMSIVTLLYLVFVHSSLHVRMYLCKFGVISVYFLLSHNLSLIIPRVRSIPQFLLDTYILKLPLDFIILRYCVSIPSSHVIRFPLVNDSGILSFLFRGKGTSLLKEPRNRKSDDFPSFLFSPFVGSSSEERVSFYSFQRIEIESGRMTPIESSESRESTLFHRFWSPNRFHSTMFS